MSGRRALGGTDVGPVVAMFRPELAGDLAKYANATDVAMRLIYGIERPRSKVMARGLDAEPRLRKAYLDAYGGVFRERPEKWIVQHPQHPWASVSPDDVVLANDGDGGAQSILVEYKSTSVFARHKYGDAETDQIPPAYNLQVQWGMEILDLDLAHVFVGFGRDFEDEHEQPQFLYEETRRFIVPRDRELAAMALDYCERFQKDFIERRKLPPLAPVNNKRAYSQLLKGSHPCLQQQTEAPSPS